MAGASFQISIEGEEALEKRLAMLADCFGDLTPLMDIIGTVLENDTAENFAG